MRAGTFVILSVALLLAGGATRLVYLEATEGEALRRRAARQQTVTRIIPARRGEILDTRGRVLAGTIRRPSVFVDPAQIADAEFAAYSVAPLLELDPMGLAERIESAQAEGQRFVWIARHVTEEVGTAIEHVIRTRRLAGVGVQHEPVRVYPQGAVAPHVLGWAGRDLKRAEEGGAEYEDLVGRTGIEAMYDAILAGTPGRRSVTVDAGRRAVRAPADAFEPALDGATLVLTIDAYVQEVAQRALGAAVARHAAEWGVAVVMDPRSGEVLAMATHPSFDPANPLPPGYERFSETQREELASLWKNRCVTDSYEPGSIFKPFIASQAVGEGVVTLDTVMPISGGVHYFGRRPIRDVHAHGPLPIHEVISKSSNIGMGLLGERLGMERLHRYVRAMGFGEATRVGLPGEHTGLVQQLGAWNPKYSPQSIPIGQEVAVTPLQLVAAFSTFCNGGVLYRPRILRGVIGYDGRTIADYSEPQVVRQVLSPDVAEAFRHRALVQTVRSGTGKPAALEDWQVFGKTGTAQIARQGGGGYVPGKYIGSFIGGAPAGDPRVVVLVSIYKPTKGGYYGGVIAAPTVKEIIADVLAYMQVPPDATGGPPRAAARRL